MRIIIEDDYRFAAAPPATAQPVQATAQPFNAGMPAPPLAGTGPAQAGFPQPATTVHSGGEPASHIFLHISEQSVGDVAGLRGMAGMPAGVSQHTEVIDIGPAPEWLKRGSLRSGSNGS